MNKELKNEIESIHRGDYDCGSWGAATSTPYRVKTYLTPAQSRRIKAAYETLRAKVEEKLADTPKSKQENWDNGFAHADLHCDSPHEMNMLQGEKLLGWQLCAKTLNHVTFRNGRGHYEMRMSDPNDVIVNGSANSTGYPSYGRYMRIQIYWDAERQLYYVLEWERAGTKAIPEERRRRNWARGGKKREFLAECKALQSRLEAAGVEIKGVVRNGGRWHDQTYIDCAAPDATIDLSSRDAKAWSSHPIVVEPPEPEPIQEGPRVSEPEPILDDELTRIGTVCFTGKLERLLRQEAAAMAKRAGYGVASSVSPDLTYLVTNCPNSQSLKNRKADEYGVRKITEAEFLELMGA